LSTGSARKMASNRWHKCRRQLGGSTAWELFCGRKSRVRCGLGGAENARISLVRVQLQELACNAGRLFVKENGPAAFSRGTRTCTIALRPCREV